MKRPARILMTFLLATGTSTVLFAAAPVNNTADDPAALNITQTYTTVSVGQSLNSQEDIYLTAALKDSFAANPYLKEAQKTLPESVEFSNTAEARQAVQAAYQFLEEQGIIKDSTVQPRVLFVEGLDPNIALSFSEQGLVLVSADQFKKEEKGGEKKAAQWLAIKVAHEATHVINYVQFGHGMPAMEDEAKAYKATYQAVKAVFTDSKSKGLVADQKKVSDTFEVLMEKANDLCRIMKADTTKNSKGFPTGFKSLGYTGRIVIDKKKGDTVYIEIAKTNGKRTTKTAWVEVNTANHTVRGFGFFENIMMNVRQKFAAVKSGIGNIFNGGN